MQAIGEPLNPLFLKTKSVLMDSARREAYLDRNNFPRRHYRDEHKVLKEFKKNPSVSTKQLEKYL